MNVDFAFLCDSAQEGGGKVHALGIGLDTITAGQVPATHPLVTVVVQLSYSLTEAGEKPITVRLIDADGRDVVNAVTGDVTFPPPEGTRANTARLIVAFGGVNFTAYGDYAVHVTVSGAEVADLPIAVRPPS